jgi:hypothetical protein
LEVRTNVRLWLPVPALTLVVVLRRLLAVDPEHVPVPR